MSTTTSKVTRYTRATVDIFFPGDDVKCSLCPLLETYARRQCRRTGEYLAEGYLIGGMCPLKFNEEDNNGNPCSDPG